ncbi:hypothetical protein STAQ_42320 [Allostella sp. ATCC 35155]|nr:hypothetical protein STAQ_42320 [Stella sp. ATCC 35155]
MVHFRASLLPAAALLLAALPVQPAGAQPDPRRELRDVQRTIEAERARQAEIERRAEQLRREIERLRAESIAAARALQSEEGNLSGVEETLLALDEEIRRQERLLTERRQNIESLVTALARLTRHPPEALLALPNTPVETARTASLLSRVVPMIAHETARLRLALADLRELRLETEAKRRQASTGRVAVERRRKALDALIQQRTAARGEAETEARERGRELQQLASRANDLRDLIQQAEAEAERRRREQEQRRQEAEAERRQLAAAAEAERRRQAAEAAAGRGQATLHSSETLRLEAERLVDEQRRSADRRRDDERRVASVAAMRAPTLRGFDRARGSYLLPAAGSVQRNFGDDLGFGQHSRGITLRTRPGARVVAPFDGRILFIGPFRAYGEILIIEHSGGYHSLVAGLGRTDGAVGQTVLSGEPVGIMSPDGEERPRLYIELRRNGTPIDPQPWLAAGEGKESG